MNHGTAVSCRYRLAYIRLQHRILRFHDGTLDAKIEDRRSPPARLERDSDLDELSS